MLTREIKKNLNMEMDQACAVGWLVRNWSKIKEVFDYTGHMNYDAHHTRKDIFKPFTETIFQTLFNGHRHLRPQNSREQAMRMMDVVMETFGVEHIHLRKGEDKVEVSYCNTGDSYAATIVLVGDDFQMSSWADIIEEHEAKGYTTVPDWED